MAPKHKKDQDTAFTNFTIKVDVANNWTKTVEKVVNSVKGVRSFRMDDTGKVHVSGYIEPNVLLKYLRKNGKEAHLVHWQYGECSTNLYQNNSYQNSGFQRGGYQNGGYHQGGYGGYHNNNGNGYSYNHQPLVTYVPSYPPRGDQYASDEESSSWSIM
ncbi:heavy metal-associated isoprenylated plant protein 33-like protein [Tanacetum coccineum]